jgi:hypothetical protein
MLMIVKRAVTSKEVDMTTWDDGRAIEIYAALNLFLRNRKAREITQRARLRWDAEFRSEAANELFVRLARNHLAASLLSNAGDEQEVQRLVHYFGRFFLQNFVSRDKTKLDRIRLLARHPATKFHNGQVIDNEPYVQEGNCSNLWVVVNALPKPLTRVFQLLLAGESRASIAMMLNVSARTLLRYVTQLEAILRQSHLNN